MLQGSSEALSLLGDFTTQPFKWGGGAGDDRFVYLGVRWEVGECGGYGVRVKHWEQSKH